MPKKIGLRMILYLYLAVFLTRIGFGSITILFPLYLNAQPFQVGIILALYPIAEALSAMPVGRLADRVSRKRLHLAGMATITVLTAAIGFTQNLLNVSLLHALMGISAAMAAVTSLTLLGDATKQTSRRTKMGGFDLANLGGYGLGFGLGCLLISEFASSHYGLSEPFWVALGFLVLFGWSFPNFLQYALYLAPLFFMASAIAPAILSYVSDISGKARRGSANGIYSVVLSIGMAVGNILGGFVAEEGGNQGIQNIFFVGAAILLPSILLTSSLLKRR